MIRPTPRTERELQEYRAENEALYQVLIRVGELLNQAIEKRKYKPAVVEALKLIAEME